MEDVKEVAETEDTAAATEEQPEVEVKASPDESGKEAKAEKIDLDRVIEDESYAAQVLSGLTKPEGEPEPEKAKEVDGEQTIILESPDGTRERVPVSQVQNRWRQAKHLQEKYETEAAPRLKLLRQHPELQQAIDEAVSGRNERLLELLGKEPTPEELERKQAREQEIFKRARKNPKLSEYTDDELRDSMELLTALESAKTGVVEAGEQEFNPEQQREIEAHLRAAISIEPSREEAIKTLEFVNSAIAKADELAATGQLRDPEGKPIPKEAWLEIREAINDPNHPENFLRFFKEMGEQRRGVSAAPAAATKTPVRRTVSARIAPGALSQSSSGPVGPTGLPVLEGKSIAERRAALDRFLEVQ